jgi:hypothetical protein
MISGVIVGSHKNRYGTFDSAADTLVFFVPGRDNGNARARPRSQGIKQDLKKILTNLRETWAPGHWGADEQNSCRRISHVRAGMRSPCHPDEEPATEGSCLRTGGHMVKACGGCREAHQRHRPNNRIRQTSRTGDPPHGNFYFSGVWVLEAQLPMTEHLHRPRNCNAILAGQRSGQGLGKRSCLLRRRAQAIISHVIYVDDLSEDEHA